MELIAIPSVNPFGNESVPEGKGELAAAQYVATRLTRLGWATKISEFAPRRANILASAPRSGASKRKAVVLAGHLDTVEVSGYTAPFDAKLIAGRIYGRGACDMKAALACYIECAEMLATQHVTLEGELLIAGVADEEYRQTGAKVIRRDLPATQLVVIGEPTELKICTAAKGLAAYTLEVSGRATHGSVPDAGSNAIVAAAGLVAPIVAHGEQLTARAHALLGPGVLNIGVIRGGLKPNIVPSSCELEISRRLLPDETAASARDMLVQQLQQCRCANPWRLSDSWWSVDPYENSDQAVISAFQTAVATSDSQADGSVTGFPASSDAAYFGAPALIYGPGSLAQAHSLDEWVTLEDMVTATRSYLQFILDRLAPARRT